MKSTRKTVVVLMMTNPAISGGGRVVVQVTRRTSTWTPSLNEWYVEMKREAELRFGNGGARVMVFVDGVEWGSPVVGERL